MKTNLNYSKGDIDKAGKVLAGGYDSKIKIGSAIEILENFRALHIHPMLVFRMLLQRKSNLIKITPLISQRLKRAPSVVNKLKIQKSMSLSQMQDVGGLRAVVNDILEVYKLKEAIRDSENQPAFKSVLTKEFDYIEKPKESGYRSLHLVYKYGKNEPDTQQCRVEIQIRTKIQHAWATAIEVIGTYTNQPLKQSFGEKDWLELFKKISKAFSSIENNQEDIPLYREVLSEVDKLNLKELLERFSVITNIIGKDDQEKHKGSKFFLITLNFKEKELTLQPYSKTKLDQANNKYSELEKKYLNDSSVEVVLVSVDDVNTLRKLYPNYFMDTYEFIQLLNKLKEKVNNYEK
jgi:ppGpp synthetase/RelA/SpoT-type nucleotidyltranferase